MKSLISAFRNRKDQHLVTAIVACALLSAVGFNLWHLFPETTGGGIPTNDNLYHLQLIDSAVDAVSRGQDITDPWNGNMSLGFPIFHYYQHLPHVSVALVHVLLFKIFPVVDILIWVTYILLSLFPLSIYWSLRRFSIDPLTSAMGGLLSSLIGTDFQLWGGFGYANYTFDGWGLYTQLWGMVLLPISLAFGYRTICTGKGYFVATLVLSVTLLAHVLYGYMAFITLALLAFVAVPKVSYGRPLALALWEHWRRLFVLFVLVVTVTLYFLVPLVLDHEHYGKTAANTDSVVIDSFGFRVVLEAMVRGDLFDLGRFPSFSLLVLAGVFAGFLYRQHRSYLIPLAIFLMWLLLFFGRSTWGPMMNVLPFSQDIHMHRFIGGVHLGGIFLAAIALAVPWRWAVSKGNTWYILGALALTVLILSPVYVERRAYLTDNAAKKENNQRALDADRGDIDRIVRAIEGMPPGRVFAGLTTESGEDRWGFGYHIGGTPVAQVLGRAGLDVFSSTLHQYSLLSNELDPFDENSPVHYDLFNIKYVVVPEKLQMPNFMEPVETFGRHKLLRIETTGYFDLVGSSLVFTGDKEAYSSAARAWLVSGLPKAKLHPKISVNGSPTFQETGSMPSTIEGAINAPPESSFESVEELNAYIAQANVGSERGSVVVGAIAANYFSASVDVERESILMLKTAYHPNWRATVGDVDVNTIMLMPGFLGIQLAPGEHEVEFEYRSRSLRKVLLGFGLLILISIWIWEKWIYNNSSWLKIILAGGSSGTMNRGGGNRSSRRRRGRRNR